MRMGLLNSRIQSIQVPISTKPRYSRIPVARRICILTRFNKVDFQQLDTLRIKPVGIYGSLGKLVELLATIGCIDSTMYVSKITYMFCQNLMVYCRSHTILDHSVTGDPSFRTGLYIVDARNVENDLFYVIYWPEKTTWERNVSPSVSRNRVTFLRFAQYNCSRYWPSKHKPRYLTKLCNQVVCLISDEDQAQLHWDSTDIAGPIGEATQANKPASKRAYRFQVQHINHQHESAKVQDGFTVSCLGLAPDPYLTLEGWLWSNITCSNYSLHRRRRPCPGCIDR